MRDMPAQTSKSGLRLTSGDVEILTWVYQLRLSTIEHLVALTGRERTRVNRRLVRMLERKYLYRRRSSVYDKYVYTLNKQAIPILMEQGVTPTETFSVEVKRLREFKDLFLKHALMLTDIHTTLELASRHSPIKLIDWREGKTRVWDTVWVYEKGERKKKPVRPDAFLTLEDTRRPEGQNRRHIFLEADRSTTNNERFQKKIKAYHAYIDQGLHTKKYGIKSPRVVTITRTEARAVNLCAASREVLPSKDAQFYYYASTKHFSLENPVQILDAIFISPKDFDTDMRYSLMPPLAK